MKNISHSPPLSFRLHLLNLQVEIITGSNKRNHVSLSRGKDQLSIRLLGAACDEVSSKVLSPFPKIESRRTTNQHNTSAGYRQQTLAHAKENVVAVRRANTLLFEELKR